MNDSTPLGYYLVFKKYRRQGLVRFLVLLIGCFGFGFLSFGQHIIYSDPTQTLNIGKKTLFFADSTREMTLEGVLKMDSTQFERIKGEAANFKTSKDAVWCKFTVTNQTDKPLVLDIDYRLIRFIDLYLPLPQGGYKRKSGGQTRDFENRDFDVNTHNFDLELAANETKTYFLRVQTTYILIVPLHISSITAFVKENHYRDLLQGIYLGLIIIMTFYNLFVYFTTRDLAYLFYVIYSISIGLLNGHLAGLNFEFLHPHYGLWNNFGLVYPGIAGILAIVFSWQFLNIKENAPRWQWPMGAIIVAYIIGIVSVIFNHIDIASAVIRVGGLLIPIVLISSAVTIYIKGYKPALYYLVAWGTFLAAVIVYLLISFDLLPQNEFTGNAMEIGSTLEVVLLSIALADKINYYKEQNEKAQAAALAIQKKANEELEMKVKERTEEIVKINEEIMAQRDAIEEQRSLLEVEKDKSDKLLLNILPSETAKELKDFGFAHPRFYEQATVMFTDFKQFTNIAEQLTPQEIIQELDRCFLAFDDICEKYGLERIKTIGDAYMACGGIPIPNQTNPIDTVKAALEIQKFILEFNKEKEERGVKPWQVRIGIHTGAVVAGVVGKKKFAYDIWGDAVNVASRMESHGEIGKVNISGQTFELVKDIFQCTYRGKVLAKNKGEVDMYFVEG